MFESTFRSKKSSFGT